MSYHDYPNTPSPRGVDVILGVNAASYGCGPVIVQIIMQLPISSTELLLLEEQGVVKQCQGIKDVKIELVESS